VLTGSAAFNGTGNTLNNSITGNGANNILDGGLGVDTMAGGLGNDTYVVDNAGGIFANFKRYKGDHIAVYVVDDWERPRIPVRSLEIVEQKFFDLRSLPNGLIEGTKRRLDEIFNQRPSRDEW
jgi:hypothetical protein